MENPKRARSWKRRLRPRVNLKNDVPVLYSTATAGSGMEIHLCLIGRMLVFIYSTKSTLSAHTINDDPAYDLQYQFFTCRLKKHLTSL